MLIFGLSIAPAIFHKVMRELVRFLRSLGISVLNYLDDFLWSAPSKTIGELVQFVKWLLPLLGWLFNEKCVWEPGMVVTFFGLLIDAEKYEYRVPADKLRRVASVIEIMRQRAHEGQPLALRDLQVLTGTLMSYRLAVSPVRVWTRGMYADIAKAESNWAIYWTASADTMDELDFWHARLQEFNGAPIVHPLAEQVLHVDASDYGWGGVLNVSDRVGGYLPLEVIGSSSTLRELRGLRLAAVELEKHLVGKRLRVEMDSFAAIRNLINGGGPVAELCAEVKAWWSWCAEKKIVASYTWIPREENKEADRLSKAEGRQWSVRPEVKKMILDHFRLREDQWRATEFGAIGHMLKQIQRERAMAALLFPGWPAQSWWLEIHKHAKAVVELGRAPDVFTRVEPTKRIGVADPSWMMFCAILDFTRVV